MSETSTPSRPFPPTSPLRTRMLIGNLRDLVRGRAATGPVVAAGLLLALVAAYEPRGGQIAGAVAGVMIVLAVARHRVVALGSLIIYLPIQQTLLAFAYSHGFPGAILRAAGFYKEAVTAGLLVALVVTPASQRSRTRAVDVIGYCFVALETIYLVAPFVFAGALGGGTFTVRIAAWRLDCLFVLLFLIARRLPWSARDRRRLISCVITAGFLTGLGGVYQLIDQAGYDHFLTDVVRQPAFVTQVLGGVSFSGSVLIHGNVGSTDFVRLGSWILDTTTLGFCLELSLLLALSRLIEGGRTLRTVITLATIGLTIAFTLTRSAILGVLIGSVICVVGGMRSRQRRAPAVLLGVLLLAVLLAPLLPSSNLSARIAGVSSSQDESAVEHKRISSLALHSAETHPLGLGLSSNPGAATTYRSDSGIDSENYYLQVANETGYAGFLLFLALTLCTLSEFLMLARRGPPEGRLEALTVGAAMLGLAVGGIFLHVWLDFQTSLPLWGMAGVVTATALPRRRQSPVLPAAPAARRQLASV